MVFCFIETYIARIDYASISIFALLPVTLNFQVLLLLGSLSTDPPLEIISIVCDRDLLAVPTDLDRLSSSCFYGRSLFHSKQFPTRDLEIHIFLTFELMELVTHFHNSIYTRYFYYPPHFKKEFKLSLLRFRLHRMFLPFRTEVRMRLR